MAEETTKIGTVVISRLIEEEMKQSYLDYSMSVIVGRALPDVRDGLKPVHRRVLYAMWEMGMHHNKPFKKCARVVGDCLGKYHPHGDTAVYDTLVRLAQDFSMRYPLIQGQGNFGSIDGDPAAAMRYTECRLTKQAEEMLADIDKKTVKFIPNFDNSVNEPTILPAKLPNLLLNGSSGIAVGMATNIPPHNLPEVIDGVILQIDNPEISIPELMQSIKGPDFPTGGIICNKRAITEAYSSGRGKLTVRAKTHVEQEKNETSLIISEIPYMVNKSELIEEIAALVREKRIIGISDIRDESDKRGMRIVLEIKKDANTDVILNQLFKHSRMQVTFGVIMLALVKNVPKVLNLKQIIHYYIEHRKDVVRKRALFELNKAQTRSHILEGILIAISRIDEVIKSIKESKSVDDARNALTSAYNLTHEQAVAILEMRLQRLTSLEHEKVKEENKQLLKLIDELEELLSDPKKILESIKKELMEIKESYQSIRRTEIADIENQDFVDEDLIKDEEMVVTVTHSGYIKRISLDTYKIQHRGGKGIIATTMKEEDLVKDIFIGSTHSYILFFTNRGKVHWLKLYEVPEATRIAKGKAVVNMLQLDKGEDITAFIPVKNFDSSSYLIMATKKGTVKKTELNAYSNPRKGGIAAITLEEGDELINVEFTDGKKQMIIATKNGLAVRFNEANVRSTGRSSQGVKGISLKDDDEVVGMVVVDGGKSLLTVTENGYGKKTLVDEYRLINRGGSGVINIQCTERNGKVVSVCCISDDDEIMFISKNGIIIRVPSSDISAIGRNTQGVTLMKLEENDKIVSAVRISGNNNGQ